AEPKAEPQAPPAYTPTDEADLLLLTAARLAAARGDFPTAIDRYQRYLEKNPRDVIVRREFAGVLVTARELRRAVEQYERAIALDPTHPPTRVLLGDVYVVLQQFRPAISQYMEALEQLPDTPENLRPRLEVAVRLARAYAFDSDMVRATQV